MSTSDPTMPAALDAFTGEPQALNVRFIWLRCLLLYFFCALVAAAAVVINWVNSNVDLSGLQGWYWVALPLLILLTVYTVLSSRAKGYLLCEHWLSFHTGLIFKSITVAPFSRLQHIEITRGPLERALGLATLKLFSAGGAQHAVAVPGLALARAEQLRSAILDSKGLGYEQ